jgi:8-oxo-dGTP pyrophosphatase MutT (NUDIX family)
MSSKHRPANPESALHVKHRETARILLSNERSEIFLIQTHWDPGTGLPPRWLTPGGGIDAGETIEKAAIRELFEETGMSVTAADLGDLVHRMDFRVVWANGTYETGVAHLSLIHI